MYFKPTKDRPDPRMHGYKLTPCVRTSEWSEDFNLTAPDGLIYQVRRKAGENAAYPSANGVYFVQTKAEEWLLLNGAETLSFPGTLAIVEYLVNRGKEAT